MTTKWKIIVSFIILIVVTGVVAAIGYFGLSSATEAFGEYRRMARLNVRTSDMLAQQLGATADLRQFIAYTNSEDINKARDEITASQALIEDSKQYAHREDIRNVLSAADEQTAQQLEISASLEKAVMAAEHAYENTMQPALQTLSEELTALIQFASSIDNERGVRANAEALDHLGVVRVALNRFSYTRTQADAALAEAALTELNEDIETIRGTLLAPEGQARFAAIKNAYDNVTAAYAAMQASVAEGAKHIEQITSLTQSIREGITKISNDSNTQMTEQGSRTLEVNATAQKSMLAVTVAGLLVGTLLAAFIIIGLVRVLRSMSLFADAISKGDFDVQVNSREKGEIGHMLTALRNIPQVLERLTADIKASSGKIIIGDYRHRIDAASFSGGFNTLARAVNDTCHAYTTTLDHIPLAVITCDLESHMLYLNDVAKLVLGSDMSGSKCGSCFKSPVCNTDKCFALNAKKSGKPYSGETDIHPDSGNNLEISVTAIPLNDENGVIQGHLEICADISAMKSKERAIAHVAEQASSISNRVAAASEELSAQVEQVSHGAEMQRTRVEGTASAMTEMNSTVLEVAHNASQASEQSELTRNKAADGAALVSSVVQSINLVNNVASKLQTNMQELGVQAENIGGVMDVISDIADQTNLLALNAAIEAARAGEAGRGFAVVADEVRKLAEKTMSATHEVGSSITAIQNSARTNIDEVNLAVNAVTEATELANNSGHALEEIVDLASSNSSVVASIATAAEEQSATSEEINRAIDEINQVVNETSDGMVQSSAAVHELSRMAQELNTVIGELQQ